MANVVHATRDDGRDCWVNIDQLQVILDGGDRWRFLFDGCEVDVMKGKAKLPQAGAPYKAEDWAKALS